MTSQLWDSVGRFERRRMGSEEGIEEAFGGPVRKALEGYIRAAWSDQGAGKM